MSQPVTLKNIHLPGRADDPDFHLATYEAGNGPAVVFVHGFPDLAIGWQFQLPAVAAAGFRAIAPDMRGYGGSSCPHPVEAYTMAELTGDLVALLDALGIEKAIFVGHDWGGFVSWAMPVLHPDRVAGVAGVCTPYIPFPSVALHTATVDGEIERQYVSWFQLPDIAEKHMDQHVAAITSRIMRTSAPLSDVYQRAVVDGKFSRNPFLHLDMSYDLGQPLLSDSVFKHYVDAFTRTGYRGGINWYRNIDNNAATHPDVGTAPLDIPCLMLMAELDPGLRPEFADDMPERCSDLEMHLIRGAAHWVQQEDAETLNAHLISWLKRRF